VTFDPPAMAPKQSCFIPAPYSARDPAPSSSPSPGQPSHSQQSGESSGNDQGDSESELEEEEYPRHTWRQSALYTGNVILHLKLRAGLTKWVVLTINAQIMIDRAMSRRVLWAHPSADVDSKAFSIQEGMM